MTNNQPNQRITDMDTVKYRNNAMIRLINHTDADELFGVVESNRKYLKQWLPWLDFNQSVKDTEQFISKALHDYANKLSLVCVIMDNDCICGVCGFNSFNYSIKAGYIGYWISESHQGNGIITKACQELEGIAFEKMNLNKVEIHAATENSKSRNVAIRLGYVHTGKLLDAEWLYNKYVDHEIYCKIKGNAQQGDAPETASP